MEAAYALIDGELTIILKLVDRYKLSYSPPIG